MSRPRPRGAARGWSRLVWLTLGLGCWIGVAAAPVEYSYRVVATYPHAADAYTQGLLFHEGRLYESTGLRGRSSLRVVELETGKVLASRALDARLFAEGLARVGDELIQLTWTAGLAAVYDLATLRLKTVHRYQGEGWGLCFDGRRLIMSDGSSALQFRDPTSFRLLGQVTVKAEGRPVSHLNELECIEGEVFANVWQTDRIARIDPASGEVNGWIDLTGLLSPAFAGAGVDVLNGIAFDPAGRRLFVTGKLWPRLFAVELVPVELVPRP